MLLIPQKGKETIKNQSSTQQNKKYLYYRFCVICGWIMFGINEPKLSLLQMTSFHSLPQFSKHDPATELSSFLYENVQFEIATEVNNRYVLLWLGLLTNSLIGHNFRYPCCTMCVYYILLVTKGTCWIFLGVFNNFRIVEDGVLL